MPTNYPIPGSVWTYRGATLGEDWAPGSSLGTTTNDNALPGYVGEYIASLVEQGSSVSIPSSGAVANVTTISLTPGDWNVGGIVAFNPGGTTTINGLRGAISLTSLTFPDIAAWPNFSLFGSFATGFGMSFPVGGGRVSLAVTTTLYLVASAIFGVSTMGAYGSLYARRAR